jgi:hypothetical protein
MKNKVLSQKIMFFPTKTKAPLSSVGDIAARIRRLLAGDPVQD